VNPADSLAARFNPMLGLHHWLVNPADSLAARFNPMLGLHH